MKHFLILALLGLLATTPFAWAQTDNQRLQDLEERLVQIEQAQPTLSTHQFQITGYMSATYYDTSESVGSFGSSFSPLFLYRAGDNFLFEAELALGFEGDETELELEYAQFDYLFADKMAIVAGKFLLPFGIFGERLHPSWINKLPSSPPIYGGHGPSFHEALIPIMTDFGVQMRGGLPLGSMSLTYALYVVNGPRAEVVEEGAGHGDPGPLTLSPSADDNNDNKAIGFRVGLLPMSGLEVGASYYSGKVLYTPSLGEGALPATEAKNGEVKLSMLDVTYYSGGLRILSEYLVMDTSGLDPYTKEVDPGTGDTTHEEEPGKYNGYYVQLSYMHQGTQIEPVIRYGSTSKEGVELGNQITVGVNMWLDSSLALKIAYSSDEIADMAEPEENYMAQLTFGF